MASPLERFFRSPDTGKLVIAQRPNAPLLVFFAATAMRLALDPSGTAGTVVSSVGTASLAWWATAELLGGDSPFRRVLGGGVLAGLLVRVLSG